MTHCVIIYGQGREMVPSFLNENDYHEEIYRPRSTVYLYHRGIFICNSRLHLLNFFAII